MRARPFVALCVLAVAVPVLGQNHPADAQKRASDYSELAKAPEKARVKRNPLERDPDSIPAGRNLFDQHCAQCHGEQAEGWKRGPSLRVSEVQSAPPGAIFWLISNGVVRKGMPVWSKLPEPERWQLVAFIKSLGVGPSTREKSGSDRAALPNSPSPPH
jgi:mono/diheme cytochrome c family protein